ncbi:hypothetical protein Syun_002534 [Stephania yunnanensis]|uniref:Uncharacterized protein n=1 Tax=Stephania yunnanensis TaxID=152371 RepID=A0AAP0Q8W1_9MAGN
MIISALSRQDQVCGYEGCLVGPRRHIGNVDGELHREKHIGRCNPSIVQILVAKAKEENFESLYGEGGSGFVVTGDGMDGDGGSDATVEAGAFATATIKVKASKSDEPPKIRDGWLWVVDVKVCGDWGWNGRRWRE